MYSYDFTPIGETEPAIHKDVTYELEQYPVDETEKDLEKHCTPAIRGHMKDYVERHRHRWPISSKVISPPRAAFWLI